MSRPPRTIVVGLDCAPPSLVFGRYRAAMPFVSSMMERGVWGPLRSCAPPITVPAWTCMVSGRDPGELGLYGFRNRVRNSYELAVCTSRDVRVKRVWDLLGEAGHRVAVLFVPLTWPPPPVRGQLVSCFLTPALDRGWAFPRALEAELTETFGPYRPDVDDFRSHELDRIFAELEETAEQHFAMAEHVWRVHEPAFLMMVEMGTDRLHHAAWRHMDPDSAEHRPDVDARARAYYAGLDRRLARLAAQAGDDTALLVVSDHGARTMRGAVRINEWLRRGGWLATDERHRIDWSRTRAWGEGGYYARVSLNVRGREPEGIVEPSDAEAVCAQLAQELEAMTGPDGRRLANRAVRPADAYRQVRGEPPDLLVYLDDLALRSLGGLEPGPVFTDADDRGPDGCNHDWDGVFVMSGGAVGSRGRIDDLAIYDVTRTVLGLMGVPAPDDILGRDRSRT